MATSNYIDYIYIYIKSASFADPQWHGMENLHVYTHVLNKSD